MDVSLTFARLLEWASRIGLALLVAAFVAYVAGWLAPLVPLEDLPRFWGLPSERFIAETGAPRGWAWLAALRHGDYLGLAGVALLALATLVCYLPLAARLLRERRRLEAGIALAQVIVLLAAVSGLVAGT